MANTARTRKPIDVPNLPSVRRETVQDRVYATLRTAIMSGQFAPGQVLSIRSLAKELGTSPMPVRDAIGRLVTEKAVDVLPNRSLTISKLSPDKIRELTRIRIEVEGMAADEAALRITNQELRKLDRISDEFLDAGRKGDLASYLAKNQEFHFLIYRAARMPMLMHIIDGLWLQFGPTLNALLSTQPLEDYDTTHHDAAIEALKKGDGAGARRAIAGDLRDAADEMLESGYFDTEPT